MTDTPYRFAAAALAAWQRNAQSALQWAHPSWLASTLGIDEVAAIALIRAVVEQCDSGAAIDSVPARTATASGNTADVSDTQAHKLNVTSRRAVSTSPCTSLKICSLSLLRSVGLSLPELHAVANPGAIRVDALPPESGLRVLRIRALRFRRSEIRRIVDKRMRASIVQWTGLSLDRLIVESPNRRRVAPDIEQMSARVPIPPVTMLDADGLALEGHALIKRDLRSARSPCPLLRLALPIDTEGLQGKPPILNCANSNSSERHRWVEQIPVDIDQYGTDALFAELPNLLPEYAWLYG